MMDSEIDYLEGERLAEIAELQAEIENLKAEKAALDEIIQQDGREIARLKAREQELENQLTLTRAEAAGAGSLLRDVQQDCIAASQENERLLQINDDISRSNKRWMDEAQTAQKDAKNFMDRLLVVEAEIERLKDRETELLATCNKYLQEARDARAALRVSQLSESLLRSALTGMTSGTPPTKAT